MQYLLTEEEYTSLKNAAETERKRVQLDLQKLCTMVADSEPVRHVVKGGANVPWGCIRTATGEWYCDECPVQDMCPYPHKIWSK